MRGRAYWIAPAVVDGLRVEAQRLTARPLPAPRHMANDDSTDSAAYRLHSLATPSIASSRSHAIESRVPQRRSIEALNSMVDPPHNPHSTSTSSAGVREATHL